MAANIDLAKEFVKGLSFEEFSVDTKTLYAVIRCLEIISEASRRLPSELLQRHPDIPWIQIARAGNIYRHEYNDVREKMIWTTIHGSLDPLEAVVRQELARLNDGQA